MSLYVPPVSFICPHCGSTFQIKQFGDFEEVSSCERPMGLETQYEINFNSTCPNCGKCNHIFGSIWEYPNGAYNYHELNIEKCQKND
jgi:predicted RNA-binding Zn-ribbon protein involved in translation (DUF1610 family)